MKNIKRILKEEMRKVILEYQSRHYFDEFSKLVSMLQDNYNRMLEEIQIKHDNGENVSVNEFIIKKIGEDISNLKHDINFLNRTK